MHYVGSKGLKCCCGQWPRFLLINYLRLCLALEDWRENAREKKKEREKVKENRKKKKKKMKSIDYFYMLFETYFIHFNSSI